MKTKTFILTFALLFSCCAMAQTRVDSLVSLRKTNFIDGKVPAWYTPGHTEIAMHYQKIITEAIQYFESRNSKSFNVKLAVIDSTSWLQEVYSYGFVFFVDGWIGMNTGMSYATFARVYGLSSFSEQLKKELKKNNISQTELIQAMFDFYCIHELGHYFIHKLSNTRPPDNLTSEFTASYFSYEYLLKSQPRVLEIFELFCKVDRDNFSPKYVSVKDFNQLYGDMGVGNYVWYHSNFYFLVKSIYSKKGDTYLKQFESVFSKTSEQKLSDEQIRILWDSTTDGLVNAWAKELESKKTVK